MFKIFPVVSSSFQVLDGWPLTDHYFGDVIVNASDWLIQVLLKNNKKWTL